MSDKELVRITNVEALDGFNVHLTFSDGTERGIDLDTYLHGPVFEPIRNDPALFQGLRVDDEAGTISGPMARTSTRTYCTLDSSPPGWKPKKKRF